MSQLFSSHVDKADGSSIMALLGMKDQAAAARFSNVGSLGALRLNEEFVSAILLCQEG